MKKKIKFKINASRRRLLNIIVSRLTLFAAFTLFILLVALLCKPTLCTSIAFWVINVGISAAFSYYLTKYM